MIFVVISSALDVASMPFSPIVFIAIFGFWGFIFFCNFLGRLRWLRLGIHMDFRVFLMYIKMFLDFRNGKVSTVCSFVISVSFINHHLFDLKFVSTELRCYPEKEMYIFHL